MLDSNVSRRFLIHYRNVSWSDSGGVFESA